jgi:ribonuclease III
MEPFNLDELEQKIQYRFQDKALLIIALRHSSFVNEQDVPCMQDNERLEFLGDAVLSLIVGHLLMCHYSELKEGDLSRMRARLVNESQLAAAAREIDLGAHIMLGKGELQTDGHNKSSILADTFEALLAAVYLDGGYDAAFRLIQSKFSELILSEDLSIVNQDYKSRLQELVQTTGMEMPEYRIVSESGPDHDKRFTVQLKIREVITEGEGRSKKIAEQRAARKALDFLLTR